MPLFEVAIIVKPTKKEAEEGIQEKLAYGPKAVIASSHDAAGIAAVNGEKLDIPFDRAEVLVRPFVL